MKLLGALLIIIKFRVLIDKKVIRVNNTLHRVCKNCLEQVQKIQDETSEKLYEFAVKEIVPKLKDITIELDTDHSVILRGVGGYLPINDLVYRFGTLPPEFDPYKSKIPVKLPKKFIPSSLDRVIQESINNLIMQKLDPYEGHRFTYLSNNRIETEMINHLNKDFATSNSLSSNIVQGLTHSAPFVRNIPIKTLLELREYEEESFNRYQNAILKITTEPTIKSQKDFKEAMSDIVNPELEKLDRMFKLREKNFNKAGYKNIAIEFGLVVIGLFDPTKLSLISAGLTIMNDILSSEEAYKNIDSDLKQNDFYFLWKVKNLH